MINIVLKYCVDTTLSEFIVSLIQAGQTPEQITEELTSSKRQHP